MAVARQEISPEEARKFLALIRAEMREARRQEVAARCAYDYAKALEAKGALDWLEAVRDLLQSMGRQS
jgi:hypothetical protein